MPFHNLLQAFVFISYVFLSVCARGTHSHILKALRYLLITSRIVLEKKAHHVVSLCRHYDKLRKTKISKLEKCLFSEKLMRILFNCLASQQIRHDRSCLGAIFIQYCRI